MPCRAFGRHKNILDRQPNAKMTFIVKTLIWSRQANLKVRIWVKRCIDVFAFGDLGMMGWTKKSLDLQLK